MAKKRHQLGAALKARVGPEALKGTEPVHAIAARLGIHPTHLHQWEKKLAERLPDPFARQTDPEAHVAKEHEEKFHEETGVLKMQLEWLKRSWPAWAMRSGPG